MSDLIIELTSKVFSVDADAESVAYWDEYGGELICTTQTSITSATIGVSVKDVVEALSEECTFSDVARMWPLEDEVAHFTKEQVDWDVIEKAYWALDAALRARTVKPE